MSCGNGCGCCSKCGCHATCTCNQSMWFDENMDDFSRNSVILVVGEAGKSGSHYAGYPAGTCTDGSSFSTRFFSACGNSAHGD